MFSVVYQLTTLWRYSYDFIDMIIPQLFIHIKSKDPHNLNKNADILKLKFLIPQKIPNFAFKWRSSGDL